MGMKIIHWWPKKIIFIEEPTPYKMQHIYMECLNLFWVGRSANILHVVFMMVSPARALVKLNPDLLHYFA